MKKWILLISLLLVFSMGSLFATLLLEDNFTGTLGTSLTANGWVLHSGTGSPITIADPGLIYTGYLSSGIGHATSATVNNDDVNEALTSSANSGSVYYAFMINASPTTTTGDYSMHLCQSAGSTAGGFYGRFFLQKDATGNLRFGIAKQGALAAAVFTGYTYATGTTHLIIIKYTFNTGTTTDDAVKMWVNPVLNGTEPAATLTATDTGTDATAIAAVAIRQWNAGTLARFDGIRVGTTWTDVSSIGASPVITVTGSFTPFSTITPSASVAQSVTVSGANLTGTIEIAAPAGYALCTTVGGTYSSTLSLASSYSGSVYARMTGASVGSFSGNITFNSTGALEVTKAVSGVVYDGEISITGSLSAFSTPVGTPSAVQTYDVENTGASDITITAPAHFELSSDEVPGWNAVNVVTPGYKTISVRYNPVAPGPESGNITHVATNVASVNLAVSGTATTAMSITAVPGTLTFSTIAGTTSAYQSYTLTGHNLTESIVVTASAGYEVCTTSGGTYGSTVTVASTYAGLIYVHFMPTLLGSLPGTITNVANSITTTVTTAGTGTSVPLNIAVGVSTTEHFDYMGVTLPILTNGTNLPTDWKADKNTTVRLVGTYAAAQTATDVNRVGGNNMISTAGNGVNNLGAGIDISATDRCVGFISSSSATKSGNLYAKYTNTGATTITALEISYNVEKYRNGTNAAGFTVQLYYSLDGTTWTVAPGTDFTNSFAGADADNLGFASAPGATQAVTTKLLPVTVAAAGNVYLAWNYAVTSGTTTSNAQCLGVDDVVVTGRALDIVATPVISPTDAIIYTPTQTVTMTCATSGAVIHYTLDGTTPSGASPLVYTVPFTVSATTTVKAIAVKTSWIDSSVETVVYTFPINVANIAALRLGTTGLIPYHLTGEAILTLQSTVVASKNKYIQDATGAIQIYDPTPYKMTTSYNLGDGITGIYGTLTLYGNMLEFVPLQDAGAATHTSGFVPTPVNVTLAGLDATYQAKLIHVIDVSIDAAAISPFAASTNYVITDPSGAGVLRTAYADLDYIGAPFTTAPKNYTGVCLQYLTAYQLVPRSLADITDAAPPATPINPTVTHVGNDIHLAWDVSPGATSYIIYASDKPEGPWSAIDISPTNSKVIANDALNYPHRFYQITAAN